MATYPVDITRNVKTQGFGANPAYARFGLKGHNGDDWANAAGGPIRAVDCGTVDRVGYEAGGFGHYIRIRHSWGKTLYAHFRERSPLKAGETVTLGQVIGQMGTTGNSSGVHLHFGVYPNGVDKNNGYSGAVDPTGWYGKFGTCETVEEELNPQPLPVSGRGEEGGVVVEAGWNLRTGPGTNYPDVGTTEGEIQAEVVERLGDWVHVKLDVWVSEEAVR